MDDPLNQDEKITYFGETDARNKRVKFGIKSKDRTRHVYVIGKTGMGKSTLLENMAVQDIQNGNGFAFVDPHGKSAELLLEYIPKDRIKDVIYFAPFDTDYPVSFNVMEDVGADRRHLVASGLMSAFKKIWVDAWSARMEYILNNILLALLEYPDSTLLGVNRMLSDKWYRQKVVANISDPSVKSFWVDEFEKYGERYMQEAGAAIQNKIGQFTANPLVRNIVGQTHSSFDIREVMDNKKILIANLSKGKVGEANANLLGSMLITKIYLGAMSRADVPDRELQKLPNFYLFVDEFQSFANESFADILSEARKYKLNLTIAHQYVDQMSEEVQSAVFGNVGTTIAFRVGPLDAELLEKLFMPRFTAEDLVNLGRYQMYLTLMIDGIGSQPFSALSMAPIERPNDNFYQDIVEASRKTFARAKDKTEEIIRLWYMEGEDERSVLDKKKKKGGSFGGGYQGGGGSGYQGQRSNESFQRPNDGGGERKPELRSDMKKALFEAIKTGVATPIEDVPAVSPAISLQEIAKKHTPPPEKKYDSKKPTGEHVSALKEALSSLVPKNNQNNNSKPEHQKQNISQGSSVQNQSFAEGKQEQKGSHHSSKKHPNEIPEDELRKMLAIDDK
ncbi:MAG: type IV secretory system conjugative DNA transfer family protein [Minisyncoccia bacterium]